MTAQSDFKFDGCIFFDRAAESGLGSGLSEEERPDSGKRDEQKKNKKSTYRPQSSASQW